MKKSRWVGIVLVLALLCPFLRTARAEAPGKLTLMVYMCGSNLESGYGSASADLQEMIESGFDSDQVNLLVMTGGTEGWALGFDPADLTIHQVGKRGMRALWREKASSMGAPETLTALLNFGVERFPAEHYALILWNHGGGPMKGVCWDELFSMDNLSLAELTQALEESDLPGKLSWIGFDACLMSSAEVATALSPYADYMIASQDTEPAPGWNYAFLKGLAEDGDARETGRRIVDTYFEGLAGIRDTATLACVDLSGIRAVNSAMDAFFAPIAQTLDADSYARLSGLRMATVSFGKAVRAADEDDYDLVDLGDLVRSYDQDPTLAAEAKALSDALASAVVYCRATGEEANGLSVYHPYANKRRFQEQWGADYQALGFSDGYKGYLDRFGALLTGRALADWSDLPPADESDRLFSLQLTADQESDFAAAQLLILADNTAYLDDPSYTVLSIGEATLDDAGRLSARYTDRALYVADAQGNPISGPLSLMPSSNSGRYSTLAQYWNNMDIFLATRSELVAYTFDVPTEPGLVDDYSPRVWDEASSTFTNRIAFSEDDYMRMGFWYDLRTLPQSSGTLPAFDQWAPSGTTKYKTLSLPQDWRLCFVDDQLTGTRLYATFQIVDLQQNRYCTPLAPIDNHNLSALALAPAAVESDAVRLEMAAEVNASPLDPCLNLRWRLTNLTATDIGFNTDRIVLNDRRCTEVYLGQGTRNLVIAPGASAEGCCPIAGDALRGLDAVDTVGFTLMPFEADSRAALDEIPVRATLSGCDAAALALAIGQDAKLQIAPSQTVETAYGRFRVAAMLYGNGLKFLLTAENTADADCSYVLSNLRLDHRHFPNLRDTMYLYDIGPGRETVASASLLRNDDALYGLDEVSSLSCDLTVRKKESFEDVEKCSLCFRFDGMDIGFLAPDYPNPLGEAEAGGIRWQLLSLTESEDGRLMGVVRVENGTTSTLDCDTAFAAEGVTMLSRAADSRIVVAPESDRVMTLNTRYDGGLALDSLYFDPDDFSFDFAQHLPLDDLLSRHGISEITRVSFAPCDPGRAVARIELNAPMQLEDRQEAPAMPEGAPILEGPVRAELYAMALGTRNIGMCMEFANDTDRDMWLYLQNAAIDGHPVAFVNEHARLLLPAHTVLDRAVEIDTRYCALTAGEHIDTLSFEFDWHDGRAQAQIGGLGGVFQPEQGVLLTPDALRTVPARIDGP